MYDLDEVFSKWSEAKPLNVVQVKKLTNKMNYTNDNSNIDELAVACGLIFQREALAEIDPSMFKAAMMRAMRRGGWH